jgi:hypothetical protein
MNIPANLTRLINDLQDEDISTELSFQFNPDNTIRAMVMEKSIILLDHTGERFLDVNGNSIQECLQKLDDMLAGI